MTDFADGRSARVSTRRLDNGESPSFRAISLAALSFRKFIQVSTGSACSSRTLEPSHVLLAIGLKHEETHDSMVMTPGRHNIPGQIPVASSAIMKAVERLSL